MEGAASSKRAGRQRKSHARRLRMACARCHRRKVRCDAGMPSCSACADAGIECVYDGQGIPASRRTHQERHQSHEVDLESAVSRANDRVQHLEALLRRKAPHVDSAATLPGASTQADPRNGGDGPEYHRDAAGANDAPTMTSTPFEATHRLPYDGAQSPRTSPPPSAPAPLSPRARFSHQIGLVSLSAGVDPKYIGPSSGYLYAKLLNSGPRRRERLPLLEGNDGLAQSHVRREREMAVQMLHEIHQELPKNMEHTRKLSQVYFRTIHLEYPFLHEPSHQRSITSCYEGMPSKLALFQVNMVLSIAALIVSRRTRVPLPATGWCTAAMRHFPDIPIESSLQGLQCLILMLIFAMHDPSPCFSAWHLNYQCIAMVLDLGLQRDCRETASLLDKEMRTRIFWVVYTLDRKIATMMGRPIGIRDEACDLRLPSDLPDSALDTNTSRSDTRPCHMTYALHFFKLARIVSEMKYVLHSVHRDTPTYALPAIRDIFEWQKDMVHRLDDWFANIPASASDSDSYGNAVCKVQHHTTRMLLLMPSPGIPEPQVSFLSDCYRTSVEAIRLFDELYAKDLLIHNWGNYHAIILHLFALLYCVSARSQSTAEDGQPPVNTDRLRADVGAGLNILSAVGEHWPGAKRTKEILSQLAERTYSGMSSDTGPSPSPRAEHTGSQIRHPLQFSAPMDFVSGNNGLGLGHQTTSLDTPIEWAQDATFPSASFFNPSAMNPSLEFPDADFDISSLFVDTIEFGNYNNVFSEF